jgi:hypothetical protein
MPAIGQGAFGGPGFAGQAERLDCGSARPPIEVASIAHAPYRRLDGEAIGDECVTLELFQNIATGGTTVLALGRGRRRQFKPPKTGSAFRTSHIALFHSPRLCLAPNPI